MKKQIFFILLFVAGGVVAANAQGNFPRKTVEERTKRVVDTLTTVLKLDKVHHDQADSVFTGFYKDADKLRESMRQSGTFDREAFEKLMADRDEKLKKVLTDEQF